MKYYYRTKIICDCGEVCLESKDKNWFPSPTESKFEYWRWQYPDESDVLPTDLVNCKNCNDVFLKYTNLMKVLYFED
jgi:hypothetical protein